MIRILLASAALMTFAVVDAAPAAPPGTPARARSGIRSRRRRKIGGSRCIRASGTKRCCYMPAIRSRLTRRIGRNCRKGRDNDQLRQPLRQVCARHVRGHGRHVARNDGRGDLARTCRVYDCRRLSELRRRWMGILRDRKRRSAFLRLFGMREPQWIGQSVTPVAIRRRAGETDLGGEDVTLYRWHWRTRMPEGRSETRNTQRN